MGSQRTLFFFCFRARLLVRGAFVSNSPWVIQSRPSWLTLHPAAQFGRQLLPALLASVEVDDVPAGQVTDRPNPANLNEHRAARVVPEPHAGLEHHVQPGLRGKGPLLC